MERRRALPICPLDPNAFLRRPRPMGYDHLKAITNHVSTGNCPTAHPPLKELVFGGPITGSTPLLLACHYGEFDSVKYIVESCGVDVRTPATYYIFPLIADVKIDSATPLFVAASLGYSNIVRFLLEKGVDTDAKTLSKAGDIRFDGLTPLYGAVCDYWMSSNQPLDEERTERNSIVLSLLKFGADPSLACLPPNRCPIWMNRLCSVGTTVALIDHGMNLKLHSYSRRTTILHHWASLPYDFSEQDSLTIVKILVEKGVDLMIKDQFGLSPILIAASACGERPSLTILDFLLERDNISTIEKIEAMEMAGASILCNPGNATLFPKAFDYWIRAEHLRQKKKKRSHPYRKTLGQNSGGPVEWITWDQLGRVIQHPSEYRIQSILMKLRILSSRSCAAVQSFLADYFTGSAFPNSEENFNVELFFGYGAMLDTLLPFLPRENRAWRSAVVVIYPFLRTLWSLKRNNPTFFNLEVIKRSLLLFLAMDEFRLSDFERDEVFETHYTKALFSFLKLLLGLSETLKWEWIHQLFRQWGPHQLGSILLYVRLGRFLFRLFYTSRWKCD